MVGLSGKGWSQVGHASDCPLRGCTPALEPPPHSGALGSQSGTRRYAGGCRSRGSGRGAGSQLGREHRWIWSVQQVMFEHATHLYEGAVAETVFTVPRTGAHFKLIESRSH